MSEKKEKKSSYLKLARKPSRRSSLPMSGLMGLPKKKTKTISITTASPTDASKRKGTIGGTSGVSRFSVPVGAVPPPPGETEFYEEELEELIKLDRGMRSLVVGVESMTRIVNGKKFPYTFMGSQAVDWIVNELNCSRTEACRYCDVLLREGTFAGIEVSVFKDTASLYYFRMSNKPTWASVSSRSAMKSQTEERAGNVLKALVQEALFHDKEEVVQLCTPVMRISASSIFGSDASLPGSKKKEGSRYVLCISVLARTTLRVHFLKDTFSNFTLLKSWNAEEFRLVEAHPETTNSFTLSWDKPYHFETILPPPARSEFLWVILTLCGQFLPAPPPTSVDLFSLQLQLEEANSFAELSIFQEIDQFKELMTEEEEQEILRLLNTRTVNEVNALSVQLKKETDSLEAENINSLITSHSAVRVLLGILQSTDKKREEIGREFSHYQDQLDHISRYVEQIESKNNHMDVVTNNLTNLLTDLTTLLNSLVLSESQEKALAHPNFSLSDMKQNVALVKTLDHLIDASLPDGMAEMAAVQSQREVYSRRRNQYLSSFVRFGVDLIEQLKKDFTVKLKKSKKRAFAMQYTHPICDGIGPYKKLLRWAYKHKSPLTDSLYQTYELKMSAVYKLQLKVLFKSIHKLTNWKQHSSDAIIFRPINVAGLPAGVLAFGNLFDPTKYIPSVSKFTSGDDDDDDSWSDSDDSDSEVGGALGGKGGDASGSNSHVSVSLATAFPVTLAKVLPIIKLEHDFLAEYFMFTPAAIQRYLKTMFDGVADYLIAVMTYTSKLDPHLTLVLYSKTIAKERAYSEVNSEESEFISDVLKACKANLEDTFLKFIDSQSTIISSSKIVNLKKIGILEHTRRTVQFLERVAMYTTPENATLAARAYQDIPKSLFKHIVNVTEHTAAVSLKKLITRYENFLYLSENLGRHNDQLLLICNESLKCKNETLALIMADLTKYLFGQLNSFFNDVDAMYQTLRADQYETIQYESGYTNRALSKLLTKYSIAQIEKNLFKHLRKLYQHFTDDNITPTVWSDFKIHMVKKYTRFEFLVKECYQNQSLSFTSERLEQTFDSVQLRYEKKYGRTAAKRSTLGVNGNDDDDDVSISESFSFYDH